MSFLGAWGLSNSILNFGTLQKHQHNKALICMLALLYHCVLE